MKKKTSSSAMPRRTVRRPAAGKLTKAAVENAVRGSNKASKPLASAKSAARSAVRFRSTLDKAGAPAKGGTPAKGGIPANKRNPAAKRGIPEKHGAPPGVQHRELYPPIEPFRHGFLRVSEIHEI
jgi:hypothetical protein